MPHFFALPRSVRKRIYEYCLIVGEINPFPNGREWKSATNTPVVKPAVALLLVHPWIEAEAKDILYGGNTWLMLIQPDGFKEWSFWTCHGKQLRRVRTVFSQHDLITRDWIQETPNRSKGMAGSRRARTEQLHQACSMKLVIDWCVRLVWLMYSVLSDLECLDMELHQCYCPIGCCRLVDWIIRGMLILFVSQSAYPAPESAKIFRTLNAIELKVTGFENEDEEERFKKAVAVIRRRNVPEATAMDEQIETRLFDLRTS